MRLHFIISLCAWLHYKFILQVEMSLSYSSTLLVSAHSGGLMTGSVFDFSNSQVVTSIPKLFDKLWSGNAKSEVEYMHRHTSHSSDIKPLK